MTLGDSLRRGLAAGLLAGLLAGAFALLVGEIPVREAIRLEEQAAAAASADDPASNDEPLVDRSTQQALLPVATAIVGSAFGGLFGLAWTFVRRRIRDTSDWRASLKLGAAAWGAVALVPGLKYPANPPAVGDPSTIGSRSVWFLGAIGIGLAAAGLLWWFARWQESRGTDDAVRQTSVALAALVLFGLAYTLLPANTDPIEIPARLLWDFRLAAMATQLLLWGGIAVGFGWLAHRASIGRHAELDRS
jgi:hypothetical protein